MAYLDNSMFGNNGVKILAKVQMPELLKINLSIFYDYSVGCGIGGEGVKHLAKGHWPKLRRVNLSNAFHPNLNRIGLEASQISCCSSKCISGICLTEGIPIAMLGVFATVSWDTSRPSGIYDYLVYIQNNEMSAWL